MKLLNGPPYTFGQRYYYFRGPWTRKFAWYTIVTDTTYFHWEWVWYRRYWNSYSHGGVPQDFDREYRRGNSQAPYVKGYVPCVTDRESVTLSLLRTAWVRLRRSLHSFLVRCSTGWPP